MAFTFCKSIRDGKWIIKLSGWALNNKSNINVIACMLIAHNELIVKKLACCFARHSLFENVFFVTKAVFSNPKMILSQVWLIGTNGDWLVNVKRSYIRADSLLLLASARQHIVPWRRVGKG